MESYIVCGCFARKFAKAELQPPSDIKEYFDEYAECGPHMTAEQLKKFMVEVQGEIKATLAEAEKIVEEIKSRRKHPHMPIFSSTTKKCILLDEFFSYLFSSDLNPPIKSQVSTSIFLFVSLRIASTSLVHKTMIHPTVFNNNISQK